MKMMRKTALMSAACLMLTALPLPAAAADDPVLTQVAAVKNDKFTVDAKKLGYTVLSKRPEKPEWDSRSDKEWNEYLDSIQSSASYGVSCSDKGYGIVKNNVYSYDPYVPTDFIIMDRNGTVMDQESLQASFHTDYMAVSGDLLSYCSGLYWKSEDFGATEYIEVVDEGNANEGSFRTYGTFGYSISHYWKYNAKYKNLKNNTEMQFTTGSKMINGIAAVMEEIKTVTTEGTESDPGREYSVCNLSLINEKGEKLLTLAEPVYLTGDSAGGDGCGYRGYNYTMDFGSYSEDLIGFTCDHQLGTTLNDLILNTGADKDEETTIGPAGTAVSNKYKFAEHECGYADLQGNIVISQKFDEVWPFYEGIALVGVQGEDYTMKYGFIDKTGNYIVEPQYYSNSWNGSGTGCFSEGFAKVALKEGEDAEGFPKLKCGYIDKTGAEVIPLQYEDAGDFRNGIAPVKKDGKWGYINTRGETVLPFEYAETYGSDGTCFVVGKEIDGETKFGAVDADGNTILPFIFEDMSNPVNGLVYAFCNKELYSLEIAQILDTGDLTGDGEVSIDDVQLSLKAYTEIVAHKNPDLTAGQLKAADINGDGELTIEDVQYVLIYYTENKVAGKHMTWKDVMNR